MRVSVVSLGGVGIGGKLPSDFYGGVTDDVAVATVHRAVARGINFIDTSPLYAESERRIGIALEALPASMRDGLLIGSKVGDECPPFSDNGGHSAFSYDGVMCSVAHSLQQLRVVDRLDTVLCHDPTMSELEEFLTPETGGMAALQSLQKQGVVGHIGIGCVEHEQQRRAMVHPACEVVLAVNDYNLVRRYATTEVFPHTSENGVGVLNAGIFYMGLLADSRSGWKGGFLSTLEQPRLVELVRDMDRWCLERDSSTTLRAVALSFGLKHECVASSPIGMKSPEEVDQVCDAVLAAETSFDATFWDDFAEAFDGRVRALEKEDHWYYDKETSEVV